MSRLFFFRPVRKLILALFLLGPWCQLLAQGIEIKYSGMELGTYAARDAYYVEMIHLAAQKSGRDIRLRSIIQAEMRESRAIVQLKNGSIDVYWMATNAKRERSLLPIRIPLYKGLIGWRIALVHKNRTNIFQSLKSLNEIKTLLGVQGHDWPDTDILDFNGYRIHRSVSWTGMFDQVSLGRVDYFPRSVIEIHDEIDDRERLNLDVEPAVAFHYPLAFYLFVSRDRPELAKIIEDGLNIAIKDKSFDKVFMKYYGDSIRRSNLDKRKIIRLENPILPDKTPLDRKELWYSP